MQTIEFAVHSSYYTIVTLSFLEKIIPWNSQGVEFLGRTIMVSSDGSNIPATECIDKIDDMTLL